MRDPVRIRDHYYRNSLWIRIGFLSYMDPQLLRAPYLGLDQLTCDSVSAANSIRLLSTSLPVEVQGRPRALCVSIHLVVFLKV